MRSLDEHQSAFHCHLMWKPGGNHVISKKHVFDAWFLMASSLYSFAEVSNSIDEVLHGCAFWLVWAYCPDCWWLLFHFLSTLLISVTHLDNIWALTAVIFHCTFQSLYAVLSSSKHWSVVLLGEFQSGNMNTYNATHFVCIAVLRDDSAVKWPKYVLIFAS